MDTSWKIIFYYTIGSGITAQAIYDEIIKVALSYKMKKSFLNAVPASGQYITDAIFGLKGNDKVQLYGKKINGQKIKEIFITTLFLKYFETRLEKGSTIFIVLPEKETSCDVAFMVSNPEARATVTKKGQLRLDQDHWKFLFQVKEYFDYKKAKSDGLIVPEKIEIDKLEAMANPYSEDVLIFSRVFSDYQSGDMEEFFEKHTNCYLISAPESVEIVSEDSPDKKPRAVKLNPNKHNYIITCPGNTFSIVEFNRPGYLVELKQNTRWALTRRQK